MMETQELRRGDTLCGNMDTSLLKLIALVCMVIDHTAVAFFPSSLDLRVIGRIALPLYAWCLVVGCEKTRNIFRYALRLLLLAVLSQPINMMALSNPWEKLNILFLLTVGVLCIAAIQKKWFFSQFWGPILGLMLLDSGLVSFDYGWKGLCFILLLYACRHSRAALIAAFLTYAAYWGASSTPFAVLFGVPLTEAYAWVGVGPVLQALLRMQTMMWLALPFIVLPIRSDLRLPKWAGYALYPAHLAIIALARLATGVPLSVLIAPLIP